MTPEKTTVEIDGCTIGIVTTKTGAYLAGRSPCAGKDLDLCLRLTKEDARKLAGILVAFAGRPDTVGAPAKNKEAGK